MKLSKLIAELEHLQEYHGDVPVVLWDLNTAGYFTLAADNIEVQGMADGSKRISVGLNDWSGVAQEPKIRPWAP